jgi:hypothetical protein
MKNHAFLELITIPRCSILGLNTPPFLYEPTSFDAGDRNFQDDHGTLIPEPTVIAGTRLRATEVVNNRLGPTIWHGIRVTIPVSLDELCWAPYSIGDVIVDEREPGFPISNKIHSIEARIYADSAELVYIVTSGIGIDHRDVCQKVDEGVFRIVTGGDQ